MSPALHGESASDMTRSTGSRWQEARGRIDNTWTSHEAHHRQNHVWAVGGPERQDPLSFWGQGGAHARVVRVQKLDRNVTRKPRPKPTPNNHRATGLGAAHLLPSLWSEGVIFWCCWMTATGGLSRSSPPSKSSKPSKPSKPPKPPKLPKPLHPPCDRQTNSWHPRDPLEAPL